jgi:hypothetical protein
MACKEKHKEDPETKEIVKDYKKIIFIPVRKPPAQKGYDGVRNSELKFSC